MNNGKKFIVKISLMLTLAVCIIFLNCAFLPCVPRGVSVNGVPVGGMTQVSALHLLRAETERVLKTKELRICADERVYVYRFPEIYYRDNFREILSSAKKNAACTAQITYYLNGEDEIADIICAGAEKQAVEPFCAFRTQGDAFTYYEGEDGVKCDRSKLIADIRSSLGASQAEGENFSQVALKTSPVPRKTSLSSVKARTRLLYSFTTFFDGTNEGRSANIRLAAQKINGAVLSAGEVFSFNGTVGERTALNGFCTAKIIEEGRFVDGVGGGVCQVSTTLYNAALLSGLEIVEYHPHSLGVSYVAPSRDAMVSGNYFDLKFKNNRASPVYIRAASDGNSVTCTVYGLPDGWKYSFVSEVTGTIARPDPVVTEGEEDKVLSRGRDGLYSNGYLVKEKNGVTKRTLLRKDKYSPVGEIVQVKRPDNEISAESPPAAG